MRTLRNGFLAAAAAALAGIAAPTAAHAVPLFSPVADDVASVRGDGDRWVAYATRAGTVRVFDERAGSSWSVKIPCTPRSGEWDPPLIEVRGGFALVHCVGGTAPLHFRPLLLELTTRRWHEVAGLDALRARYSWLDRLAVDQVGARWVHVSGEARVDGASLWLDWRTGATADPAATAGTVIDPDAAALQVATSCGTDAFRPWMLVGPWSLGSSSGSLALRRCSPAAAPVVLEEDDDSPSMWAQLGGGAVTWSARVERLYLSRCGVRLTWATSHSTWFHSSRSLWRGDQAKGTLERAPLPSCADAVGLVAGSGGRTVAPRAVAGTWPSLGGSEAELLGRPEQARPTLRVRAGGAVSLRTAQQATAVRWRLADGRWHAATGAGRSWRLAASPPRRSRPRTLTLAVTYDRSHVSRAELSLRAAR